MKIIEVCAVDFTLYRFLMPLISELSKRDHDVISVCTDGHFVERIRAQGLRVETVSFSRNFAALWQHWRSYRELVLLLRKEQADIVHVHTPIAAAVGRIAAWRAKVPKVVYTAHGFYFHEKMWVAQRFLLIGIEWFLGRFTDVLFTQSEEDASVAQRFSLCGTGIIKAIGNGVSSNIFHPPNSIDEKEQKRRSLGTKDHVCVIIIVARLLAEKGYRELFAAMKDLDAELWVVGERLPSDHAKDVKLEMESVLKESELGTKVKFLGQRDDVPELLRAADIFVLPSYREGMPRSIIEAMMTALPVVATDIRGSREEVRHGVTGLLVSVRAVEELRDALGELIRNEPLRRSMGVAGIERARTLFEEKLVLDRQIAELSL